MFRTGGDESVIWVSPSASSSQRLLIFLVPDFTPQEERESEGNLGLSHSERDCGVGKNGFLLLVMDMVVGERKRRGRERIWGILGEDKTSKRERVVKIEVGFLWGSGSGGGGM